MQMCSFHHFQFHFNKLFESDVHPELWTKGIIVPQYKKGDVNHHSNHRGLTLICALAKLFFVFT